MGKRELVALLERETFVYQRMELPYGLVTNGEDRSPTARVIFPDRLDGASVLDVGCCYGYFLYEAQRRGACRLRGLEVNKARLRQAHILRDIYGSDIEIDDQDFSAVCARERFDYVLLLNVLHHLREPLAALRTLARAARHRLIIEFVTPADQKFARSLAPGLSWVISRLPIIGVSSLVHNDQTFLFTRAALRRVLVENERLVSAIHFLRSPKREKGRLIAICEK